MKEAYDFLRNCGTFFLATDEEGQPHVRPFGALCDYEGKLYIETNNTKKVYQQLSKNGRVEICGMHEGKWIRVEGIMKEDLRREARVAMLEANPSLKGLADPDNGTMTVFFFESGTATIYSFTETPKAITL
ncbi:MAG: pyridoxamine 5'-phosphate oxidase family protein [Oscillospiraceae bacterium]|nr:pyridoxamine 5'-phosphate oxidase family protein [Oscillospiraceae bacterium]